MSRSCEGVGTVAHRTDTTLQGSGFLSINGLHYGESGVIGAHKRKSDLSMPFVYSALHTYKASETAL